MQRFPRTKFRNDRGAVFVIFEGTGSDRIAPVPPFVLTDLKPFFQCVSNRANFGR